MNAVTAENPVNGLRMLAGDARIDALRKILAPLRYALIVAMMKTSYATSNAVLLMMSWAVKRLTIKPLTEAISMSFLRESYTDAPIWNMLDTKYVLLMRRVFRELNHVACTIQASHGSLSPYDDPEGIWVNAIRVNCTVFDRRQSDLTVTHTQNAKKVRKNIFR